MGLSFYETTCGDGACSDPENFKRCPKDCPSGDADFFCDGVKDGICDPDCQKEADPDCQKKILNPYIIAGGIIIVIAGGILISRIIKNLKTIKSKLIDIDKILLYG